LSGWRNKTGWDMNAGEGREGNKGTGEWKIMGKGITLT
jgi:hypothetical protein